MPEVVATPAPATPAAPPVAPATSPTGQQSPATAPAEPKPSEATSRFAASLRAQTQAQQTRVQVQAEQRALEQRVAAFNAQQESFRSKEAQFQEWQRTVDAAKVDADPLLRKVLGDNYWDTLSKQRMTDGGPRLDTARLPELIEETVNKRLTAYQQQQQQAQQEQEKQRRAQLDAQITASRAGLHRSVAKYVSDNSTKYELTSSLGHEQNLAEEIESHFNATGEYKSVEDAADEYESLLEQQYQKALKTQKAKTWLIPAPTVQTPPTETPQSQQTQAPPGLTNNLTALTPVTDGPPKDGTMEDRLKWAAERDILGRFQASRK